jgi:SAM-dependent methyltransferase
VDTCVICGGPTRPHDIGGTAFAVCVRCGYGRLVDAKISDDYWPESIGHPSSFWTDAKSRYFTSALDLLAEKTQGRRLLDFGGGVGHFAKLAMQRGWDAYSFDISEAATAEASVTLGSHRAFKTLDDLVPDSPYDVVTLWCVVAHVDDPRTLLEGAVKLLRPGGYLWVTTPNFTFQKTYARLRAVVGRPMTFAADDHIGHFTTDALDALGRPSLGPMEWHYRGITEFCTLTGTSGGVTLTGKRAWNAGANALMKAGGPNVTSELQGLAQKPSAPLRSPA